MAYVTGTVTSLADLVTAIRNACTANGWTLSGNVLSKGGCHTEVMQATHGETGAPANGVVRVRVGNDSSSGALLEAASGSGALGPLRDRANGSAYPDWDWPVTYHIHVLSAPDEVYAFVNYHGTFWQNLMFGQSPSPGNQGTGNWFHGPIARATGARYSRIDGFSVGPGGSHLGYWNQQNLSGAPFFWAVKEAGGPLFLSSQMHGAIDDENGGVPIWSHEEFSLQSGSGPGRVSSATGQVPLLSYLPSAANDNSALIRCQILQSRPEAKTSLIGELRHLRFLRNDYISDGDVIELGHESWKVYPIYRKNAAARNGGNRIDHSGTMAMAIRYDGP